MDLCEKLVEICKAKYGDEHQIVASGLNNLAGLLKAQVGLAGLILGSVAVNVTP